MENKINVFGLDKLIQKQSAVTKSKILSQTIIDGVKVKFIRPVPHEDGTLCEIARTDWDEITDPITGVKTVTGTTAKTPTPAATAILNDMLKSSKDDVGTQFRFNKNQD
jgi:hypothetical protein